MTPELNREYPELDVPEVFEQMVELTVAQMQVIDGRLRRAQQAKATGCVTAQFRIADTVPLACGTARFGEPGRLVAAVVRFSNSQGTFESDSTPAARGLAIKLLNVTGPRARPDAGDGTQDFLMVNHPVFPFPDPRS